MEVEWRAFELHPELPPEGGSLGYDPERTKVFRARLQESAEEAGMQMRFADKVSNSRLALEATEYARTQGKLEAFHRGVFDAYFGNAENIGDPDVLARVGEAAGLDPAELRRVLEDRRYSEAVERQIELARRMNIQAVPSFIFEGKYLVQGAQPYEVFKQVMDEYVLPDVAKQA